MEYIFTDSRQRTRVFDIGVCVLDTVTGIYGPLMLDTPCSKPDEQGEFAGIVGLFNQHSSAKGVATPASTGIKLLQKSESSF